LSRLVLIGLTALSTVAGGGCGSSSENESEPLATRTSAPIGCLRGNPARELVVVDPDGSNEQTLVRMPRGHEITGFAWSPDGGRVVFSVHTPVVGGAPIRMSMS
jgi:secreted PhoX family phosphatase